MKEGPRKQQIFVTNIFNLNKIKIDDAKKFLSFNSTNKTKESVIP